MKYIIEIEMDSDAFDTQSFGNVELCRQLDQIKGLAQEGMTPPLLKLRS